MIIAKQKQNADPFSGLFASHNSISFIILTWNSAQHIERCIKSLFRTIDKTENPFEILIVDNGSTDGTVEILRNYANQKTGIVKPIYLANNLGTTYSRNLALKQSQGQYICIVDSDVEFIEGTIQLLITRLQNYTSIGLIAPKLLYGSGMLQKSIDSFPTIPSKIYRFLFLKIQERIEQRRNQSLEAREVDYAISAFWFFRRSLLDSVGFLDEKIFYAPEDVDYCLRIWKAGFKVCYEPTVSAIHNAQEISRGFNINRATFEHVKGLLYFFHKHGFWLRRPVFTKRPIAEGSHA